MFAELSSLTTGMPIIFGGNRVTTVPEAIASRFSAGDRLVIVQETGDLLHIPRREWDLAEATVGRAADAFAGMGAVSDAQITRFYEEFARRLEDDSCWSAITAANDADVASAKARGRSTTRLAVSDKMRRDMVAGLREWRDAASVRGKVIEQLDHDGWSVQQLAAGLGVVGFVFEGRPNVFADATGVLRGGNTVVFRIGSDALGTAKAIVDAALDPALAAAGLPEGAVSLLASAEHAAGWAMFSQQRLAVAVARGSGPAVAQLGAVARQAGIPVSLHGTGGAWIIGAETADSERFRLAIYNSLDRKVCNSVNVCCIVRSQAERLVPLFLDSLVKAGARRGHGHRLHVVAEDEGAIPADWFTTIGRVRRAEGDVDEPWATTVPRDLLGREWEWEETPEVTLAIVDSVDQAIQLFNTYSPQFIASLISEDSAEHERFYNLVNAPFVSDGFTRWVDGQFALRRPELGLSNWQAGRLFGRGGVLSGDTVFTVRSRVRQIDPDTHR